MLSLSTSDGKTNFFNKQNKFGLETEMIAQYILLKMNAMPTLQVQEVVLNFDSSYN